MEPGFYQERNSGRLKIVHKYGSHCFDTAGNTLYPPHDEGDYVRLVPAVTREEAKLLDEAGNVIQEGGKS